MNAEQANELDTALRTINQLIDHENKFYVYVDDPDEDAPIIEATTDGMLALVVHHIETCLSLPKNNSSADWITLPLEKGWYGGKDQIHPQFIRLVPHPNPAEFRTPKRSVKDFIVIGSFLIIGAILVIAMVKGLGLMFSSFFN